MPIEIPQFSERRVPGGTAVYLRFTPDGRSKALSAIESGQFGLTSPDTVWETPLKKIPVFVNGKAEAILK